MRLIWQNAPVSAGCSSPSTASWSSPVSQPFPHTPQYGGFPPPPSGPPRPVPSPEPPRRRTPAVVAAVVAGALLVGGVGWAVSDRGRADADASSDKPAAASPSPSVPAGPVRAASAWEVPVPKSGPDERPVSAHGAWYVDGTYVTGVMRGVTGYDPASGAVRWTVPLTGDLCAASPTATSSGQIAVSYTADSGAESPCSGFAVIDAAAGKVVWKTKLPGVRIRGLGLSVAISETTAAVGWPRSSDAEGGGSFGFNRAKGTVIWDKSAPGGDGEEHRSAGQGLVTHSFGPEHEDLAIPREQRFGVRDAVTGKATWQYTTRGLGAWIVSADPLIVAVDTGLQDYPYDPNTLRSVSADGTVQAEWTLRTKALGSDRYILGCGDRSYRACASAVTANGILYLATDNPVGTKGEIHAFDARTGKRLWAFTPETDNRSVGLVPLAADTESVTVMTRPDSMRGTKVYRVSARDGSARLLFETMSSTSGSLPEEDMYGKYTEDPVIYADERLFFHRNDFQDPIAAPMTMALAATDDSR
ncbi:PQQ-binding-like beta-propeller repeat protein [Streptomyces sp. NPDC013953]|uniref:outer membrane protein assembly factor BamB family protein n=1 Tax=Streptomyces sp. NPDC013953 TaxID=3364868 RepID=UPI0036F820F9